MSWSLLGSQQLHSVGHVALVQEGVVGERSGGHVAHGGGVVERSGVAGRLLVHSGCLALVAALVILTSL